MNLPTGTLPGMRTSRRVAGLGCVVLVVLASRSAVAQPNRPTPQFQVTMDLAAALRSKDLTKSLASFTPNAMLLPPDGDAVGGRKEVEAALKRLFDSGDIKLVVISLSSSGGGGVGSDTGTYELTVSPPNGVPTKVRGHYATVLRQDDDGHWTIDVLIWNGRASVRTARAGRVSESEGFTDDATAGTVAREDIRK